MTEAEFRALCLSFPETAEGRNMGSTWFKANGKDLARILGGERAMLTGVPIEEIEMLVEAESGTFWADNHYKQAKCLVVVVVGPEGGGLGLHQHLDLLDRHARQHGAVAAEAAG